MHGMARITLSLIICFWLYANLIPVSEAASFKWLPDTHLQAQVLKPSQQSQTIDWQERRTDYFSILYAPGDSHVDTYADFVDDIYEELAVIFSHRTDPPITIRLYPTQEAYFQATPQAAQYPGVVAHANSQRRELVVVLPLTARQSEIEVENNIRHELTHLIASELSGNRLNIAFQEGIAQYVEHPAGELETRITLLERAYQDNQLFKWSEMNDRDTVYSNPEIGYPQALSMVAFLMERYGLKGFHSFLSASERSSGYRSALERAYGVSADTLEQEWLNWLPDYIAGGYKRNAINSYDLSVARELLQQARYSDAQLELEQAIAWLERNSNDSESMLAVLDEAQRLLRQSIRGQEAEQAALAARSALEANDYERSSELVKQAQEAYAEIGDQRQNEVLATFAERAERGLQAIAELDRAITAARSVRYPSARAAAKQAASEFDALGDFDRALQARILIRSLDQRQQILGVVLVSIGAVGALASIFGPWRWREAEVW
jgi:hypothetical protein